MAIEWLVPGRPFWRVERSASDGSAIEVTALFAPDARARRGDLQLPIIHMIDAKKLEKPGQRRVTKYFVRQASCR